MASSIVDKTFVRGGSGDDEGNLSEGAAPLPPGSKDYITSAGYERLRTELVHLIDTERPEMVGIVSQAASNGDRSENGDYLYGKKHLREVDRRVRFLTRRIEEAEAIDASLQGDNDQIFFGATVTYASQRGEEKTITIVGMDEVGLDIRHVSWISPITCALIKTHVGDTVPLRTPTGVEQIDVLEVRYPPRTA